MSLLSELKRRNVIKVAGAYLALACGYHYMAAGRLDESAEAFRACLSLSPGYLGAPFGLGETMLLKGEAQAVLDVIRSETSEMWRLVGLVIAHHALGQANESDAALNELIGKYENSAAYLIAATLAWRGDADRAFEWLEKAVARHDTSLYTIIGEPMFAGIRADPRWLLSLRAHALAPEQLAAIPFEVKLPQQ